MLELTHTNTKAKIKSPHEYSNVIRKFSKDKETYARLYTLENTQVDKADIVEFGNKLAEQIFTEIWGDEIAKIEMGKFIMKLGNDNVCSWGGRKDGFNPYIKISPKGINGIGKASVGLFLHELGHAIQFTTNENQNEKWEMLEKFTGTKLESEYGHGKFWQTIYKSLLKWYCETYEIEIMEKGYSSNPANYKTTKINIPNWESYNNPNGTAYIYNTNHLIVWRNEMWRVIELAGKKHFAELMDICMPTIRVSENDNLIFTNQYGSSLAKVKQLIAEQLNK